MNRLFGLLFLLSSFHGVRCQSIDGIYVGEILGSKNAITLTTIGNSVIGYVYLNDQDRYPFLGTVYERKIQGRLTPQYGGDVLLAGEVIEDSLFVKLVFPIDTSRVIVRTLYKYSDNPKASLTKIFGRYKPQYDPMLIGSWTLIKQVPETDAKEVETIKFLPEGIKIHQDARLEKIYRELGITQQHFRIRWETRDQNMITSSDIPSMFDKLELVLVYAIHGDTLTFTNNKGSRAFYLKNKP